MFSSNLHLFSTNAKETSKKSCLKDSKLWILFVCFFYSHSSGQVIYANTPIRGAKKAQPESDGLVNVWSALRWYDSCQNGGAVGAYISS